MNTTEVKTAARRFGADLVGISPIDRFDALPPAHHPATIFPAAKSVMVIGRRILRSTVSAMVHAGADAPFREFSLFALEDQFLAKTAYDLCIWVETRGFEAVPVFSYDPDKASAIPQAVPVAAGKEAPNAYPDWKYAAVAAGLGAIGRHGLLITPQFGLLQRVSLLISDFAFEGDPAVPVDFCRDCTACHDACPLDALAPDGTFRERRCRRCGPGAIQTDFGRFEVIDRIGAACGRACQASLEQRALIRQRFPHVFTTT